MQKSILEEISSISPSDKLERDHLEGVIDWISSGAQVYRIKKPATPAKHLVAYFVLVDTQKKKVLLVDHKKSGLWLPTGGHVDLNEHPQTTVKRECQEELGAAAQFLFSHPLFLTVTQTVGNVEEHTDVSIWYALEGKEEQNYVFDQSEFTQIKWFSFDELPQEDVEPHLQRFVAKLTNTLLNKK